MANAFPALISLAPGSRALIAGGTGIVGSGVALAMLKQGAKVTIATRARERYESIVRETPEKFRKNLSVVLGDVTTRDGVKKIFEESTEAKGGIQHVVATIRGNKTWWQTGRLVTQTLPEFYAISQEEVTGHFLLMKAFLPYLEPRTDSSYTFITGYQGSGCTVPGTPNSLLCLANGTLHGLAQAARLEFKESKVAVNECHIKCLVHKQKDIEVASAGTQHVGNDLAGSAITAIVASGIRDKVEINNRKEARAWARTR